ncbi:MAG: hypothetical protein EXS30_02385 [Pedosphaera sp.]|nr:hypothetical protein [Pedosphaera sp.]
MIKQLALLCGLLTGMAQTGFSEVLIVADEFPAMHVVAAKLKSEQNIDSKLVWQTNLPPDLAPFQAVIVYIHKELSQKAEDIFINYTQVGGRLVVLHHSISSGKRKNQHWFSFLGVALPEGDVSQGGYKWIEGVSFDLVALNPTHFIMTNKVTYPKQVSYSSAKASDRKGNFPGFTLSETEVYLNHVHTEPHTLLMGIKYVDAKTGITYMQDHAGWIKPSGKGWIVYLMPGHTKHDFEDPIYGQMVINAVTYRP